MAWGDLSPQNEQRLVGDTDGSLIGNNGDSLKVYTQGPQGLSTGGKVTEVVLNETTWTALPATALTDRNAIAIQNNSDNEIKLNYSAVAGYVGIVMKKGCERQYDITDNVTIYGKSEAGTTPTVYVEELA